MTQTLIAGGQKSDSRLLSVGALEAPRITPLGSLDDDHGTDGIGLGTDSPKPLLAIIYNGI